MPAAKASRISSRRRSAVPREKRALPGFVAPMLARSGPLPEGPGWAFEVKFDGIRAQLRWGRPLAVPALSARPGLH
jgi:ATP-dependent DNA ligase